MIKFLVPIVFVQAEMQTRGVLWLSVDLIPWGEAQVQKECLRIEILMTSKQDVEKIFHVSFEQRP